MKCIPALTLDTDSPFWVERDLFKREFDQVDFCFRDQELIESNYSRHWFYFDKEGRSRFLLPTVNLISGRTQFINGRHRTAVLLDQMDRIPIAFAHGCEMTFAIRLGLEPVSTCQNIELPDLQIVERPEY